MKKLWIKVLKKWEYKRERKRQVATFLKTYNLKLLKRRETSIILGCFSSIASSTKKGKFDLADAEGNILDTNLSELEVSKRMEVYIKAAKKDGVSVEEYLIKISKLNENVKLRKLALLKWKGKFEKKFHLHFDGELKLERFSRRDGTQVLRGTGGHNHLVIDKNIRIRRFLTEPIDDKPFDALISVRYKNGEWLDKTAKSSMFPKNWSEKTVKEEIALVYDKMIAESFELKFRNNIYTSMVDTDFKITIEIDNLGNLTNAYPKLN